MADSTHAEMAQQPPEQAIARLFDTHGGKILGLGLQLCGSREDAEDLLQETFLRAFRNWSKFKGLSAPSTWLYTIAVGVCKRRHRRRVGEPARLESLSKLLPSEDEGVLDLPSPEDGPLDQVIRGETEDAVRRALGALPLHFRLPLVLKDMADFSTAQVAQVLGIKQATVKTRIHRARMRLSQEIRRSLPSRPGPPPDHERRICLDLLHAKQEALDKGVEFPIAREHLCTRCRSLFMSLQLGSDVCHDLVKDELPPRLRQELIKEFEGGSKPRRRSS
jgi:RNA polymerase sigma-70 factor (ECF subfamily)